MKTKPIITLAAIFSAALAAGAQDAGVPQETPAPAPQQQPAAATDDATSFLDNSPGAIGSVVNQALESAQDYISKKGWSMGHNNDGRYVAIGSAPVSVAPTDPMFPQMRVNAYTKAMLDAKVSVAKFIGTQIKAEVLQAYGQGSDLRKEREDAAALAARKNAGLLSKARMLLSAKLDSLLKEQGVALDSPQAAAQAGKLLNQDQFDQLITTSAKAAVAGLVCAKIFEENGKLAVVAYYSDSTRILANAITGAGPAPRVAPNPGLTQWLDALKPAQLYPTFGVQLRADENGNLVVLSFGQAVSQTDSPASVRNARTQAETMATAYIRQFAGEAASYNNVVENLERTNEFDNGTIDATADTYQETVLKSVADKLNIQGISTAKNWQTKDTRTGKFIVGVVQKWTLAGAAAANAMRQNQPAQGAPPPPQSQTRPAVPDQNKPYKIEGVGSDDF